MEGTRILLEREHFFCFGAWLAFARIAVGIPIFESGLSGSAEPLCGIPRGQTGVSMLKRWASVVLFLVALLAVSPAVLVPSAAQSPAAQTAPDFTGVWERRGMGPGPEAGLGVDGAPGFGFVKEPPPMLPWALEKYSAVRNGPLRNPNDKALDEFDPGQSCYPHGPTRIFTTPRPFEIRQFPDVVFLFFEWDHWVRRVYVDGRGHPEGYPITWMGHSIGKYEGDTLVVDTVNINDRAWVDTMGTPHTTDLHIVERFRRLRRETLEISFTFDDPKTFTRPWTARKLYKLQPPDYDILEHVICEDWLEMGQKR